jgi:predicted ATPase/DNA-binding winged helix-turn-helix (wHTH) protein
MNGSSDAAPHALRFSRFVIALNRRELLEDGVPVELGGRAFDLLLALIDGGGRVLSNEALMNRVWPGRVVEDNSLHAHISALRKAFGDERALIRTVSGRGYQFTAEVQAVDTTQPVAAARIRAPSNLPERVAELIGREAVVDDVTSLVIRHRLVTLVGSGGIGKTRLGLEVARTVLPRYADGVWLAELGPLTDPLLVPATVAAALGVLPMGGVISSERVAAAVRGRSMLLVLDNCEHVIGAVAQLTEELLRASTQLTILATSREPLLADAEYVYRVPPLDVPEDDPGNDSGNPTGKNRPSDDAALGTGAMRLFVARVRANEPGFVPDPAFTRTAAAVCRSLDGIPLAIELAAVRCGALGIDELACRLSDRFKLLSGGRRTALPRHQTLLATFEWSFDLLQVAEQVVFRRLAVFVGNFGLSAATAVVSGEGVDGAEVADHIGQLVAKSLVIADVGRGAVTYRLLETTRAYALQRLIDADELARHAHAHAAHYLSALTQAEPEFESRPPAEWRTVLGRDIDNVRAALDWAFSDAGNAELAEGLTVAAVPLWMHLSLVNECSQRVQRALSVTASTAARSPARTMRLYAALGSSLVYTNMGPEGRAAWTRTLEVAQELGDADYQLRALWGLWVDRLNAGEFRSALQWAEQFLQASAAATDPNAGWLGHRLLGVSLHFLGQQTQAAAHLDRMLGRYTAPPNRSHIIRYQFDPRVTARCFQARIRWLQGFPDEAAHIIDTTVAEARSLGHALSLVNTLGQGACQLALLTGDLEGARDYTAMLDEQASKHGIALWQAWSRCFAGAVMLRRGDIEGGMQRLRSEFTEHPGIRQLPRYMVLLGELAMGLAACGDHAEAHGAIDEALARAERNEERWYLPELMLRKGHILKLEGGTDAKERARGLYLQAQACARQQEVLAFELLAATALAGLHVEAGQTQQAQAELAPVYRRFTEGFRTPHLLAAKALLDGIG